MNEIKFRGQRKDNKKWVVGSAIKIGKLVYILPECVDQSAFIDCIVEVIPETVGQYTGLKDIKGKEIYEGDICSISKKIDMKIIVDYKEAGFGWSDEYNNLAFRGHGYLKQILKDIEIIGNRWDNPELLE